MPNPNVIFEGTTVSPVREFVAEVAATGKYRRFLLPCVGRFATLSALVAKKIPKDKIHASDFCLFSAIVGYLADPTHNLEELHITLQGRLTRFTEAAKDELDLAAGYLLAIKYLQLEPSNLYVAGLRQEIWHNKSNYRAHIRDKLAEQIKKIKGIHFNLQDVREVFASAAAEKHAYLYCNMAGYKGGYTRMFDVAGRIDWTKPEIEEFDAGEALGILEMVPDELDVVAYTHHGRDIAPPSWTTLLAWSVSPERTDYLVCNKDLRARHAYLRHTDKPPRLYDVYDEQEISADTRISFQKVDRHTALYYRDLFVHRLGQTNAKNFYLMALDGRVVTALGLMDDFLLNMQSEYIFETFGITRTSARYKRLGKLFMLALTSGDMKQYLLRTKPAYALHEPKGIQTTSITIHEEGKTDRSVMKLVSREQTDDGRFRLAYRADFRADTWPECLRRWLDRWGDKKRE